MTEREYLVFERDHLTDSELQGFEGGIAKLLPRSYGRKRFSVWAVIRVGCGAKKEGSGKEKGTARPGLPG